MEQDHDVEPVLDRPAVPHLLVTPVPEVARVAHDGERKVARLLLVPQADEVRGVLAVVVADEDLVDPRDEITRDAVQHLRQRRRRVVRDDQDPDPLHSVRLLNRHDSDEGRVLPMRS